MRQSLFLILTLTALITGCTNPLGSGDSKIDEDYNAGASGSPIATSVTSAVDENSSPFTLTLPYTSEGNLPATCQISSLSNLSITTACTCVSGVCTVGLQSTTNAFGTGTFGYRLTTANNLVSNLGLGSVTIRQVSVTVASGQSQSGTISQALASPLVAVVRNSLGTAIPGVTVTWSVVTGGGSLSACTTVSDSSGLAQCSWILGSVAGAQSATASIFSNQSSASFTATGTASSPTSSYLWTPAELGSSLALWLDADDASTLTLNTPFPSTFSAQFDGSGDYLSIPSNSAFQFGTGDFTVESWINMPAGTALTSYWRSFLSVASDSAGGNSGVTLYIGDAASSSTVAGEVCAIVGNNAIRICSGQDIRGLGWVHVALTRSGTTLRLFVNGALTVTASNSSNINATVYGAQIGLSLLSQNNFFIGSVSNVRVVKGTSVYTSAFQPPSAPLTAISGTSLLTLQSSTFIDNSPSNFTITKFGDTSIPSTTTVSQWRDKSGNGRNPTQATASAQPTYNFTGLNSRPTLDFDGTTDTMPFSGSDSESYPLKFGTNSFAVHAVVSPTDVNGNRQFFGARRYDVGWMAGFNAGPAPGMRMFSGSERWQPYPMSSITATTGAQIFGATAPRSQSGQYFKDGNLLQTTTSVVGSETMNVASALVRIGSYEDPSGNFAGGFQGGISEIILTSGVLATTDRERLEGYLAHKWGTTANLPADHPFKSSPPTTRLWTPADIGSALSLWLDANDASTITLNSGTVSQWRDKSGNGRHANQATASQQPTYTAGGQNGRAVLSFDGGDGLIIPSTALLPAGNSGFFMQFAFRPTFSGSSYGAIFGNYPAGNLEIMTSSQNIPYIVPWGVYNGTELDLVPTTYSSKNYNIGISRQNGQVTGFTDGSQNSTVANSTSVYLGGNTASTWSVGYNTSGSEALQGNAYEYVVASTTLSTADRQRLEGYLAHKWGMTADLPSDHPFKSSPPTVAVAINCPANYVAVPPLAPYTTNAFCVAKYEMKNVGGVATSQAAGTPWASIPRGTLPTTASGAWKACRDLGTGYDLISNAQWQTVARNLEGVGSNWSGGSAGTSGGMSRGHSDITPNNPLAASVDDNDSCSGTGQTCNLATWDSQRRVHRLLSGATIWDFAGNVWEWVQDNNSTNFGADIEMSQLTAANRPAVGSIGGVSGNAKYHFGPAGDYTSLSSSPFGGLGYGWLMSNASGALMRGRRWDGGVNVGVFATYFGYGPTDGAADPGAGFRCVWSPAIASAQTFTFTGTSQTFIVPANVTSIVVKAWGAGGGGGGTGSGLTGRPGGSGGYAEARLSVTPGDSYSVVVAGGGAGGPGCTSGSRFAPTGGGFPDGGGYTTNCGGAGGGGSRVSLGGVDLLIAGGGGAGGVLGASAAGGAGGGSTGASGGGVATAGGGGGGTQSSGGVAGVGNNTGFAGASLQGGFNSSGSWGSNGGGGGYFGGGTGANDYGSNANLGGAGGGSGFVGGAGVTSTQNLTGSGQTPPNTSDGRYVNGVGQGGAANTAGGNGLVIFSW